jgi:hypothetical protein
MGFSEDFGRLIRMFAKPHIRLGETCWFVYSAPMAASDHRCIVHVICTLHGHWIPGDERGFRSRGHRIHSSGDDRNPPPPTEHAGLRRFAVTVTANVVPVLGNDERAIVGEAMLTKLMKLSCRVYAVACGAAHAYVVFESSVNEIKSNVGKAKQFASFRLKSRTGQLWGEGAGITRVMDEAQLQSVFDYICHHAAKEGAWVWRCE